MEKSELTSIITNIINNDSEVTAVYLFGSRATGKVHSNSDIDLAILFNERLSRLDAYDRIEKYFVKLVKGLKTEPDVVDMEQVNLILLYEILHDGVVLLENNVDKHRTFRARKIVECIDFQVIAKRCAHGMYLNTMERIHGQNNCAVS